jgi:hypothetical protein
MKPGISLISGRWLCLLVATGILAACNKKDAAPELPPTLPPLISSFSPASGTAGSAVEIKGDHFNATTTGNIVAFNGIAAEVTAATATALTVKVPAGNATGKITVTVHEMADTSNADFILQPTIPVPGSFSPTHGEIGSAITLTGSGFAADVQVTVNGKALGAGDYISREAGKITCKIPAGATAGKIKIKQNNAEYEFTGTYTVTNIWELRNDGFADKYNNGISFVYNNKIYLGLGNGINNVASTHFKIYDPANNGWSDGADFPATVKGKIDAKAATIGNKVYIGSGFGQKDWWVYDPSVAGDAAWKQLTSYPAAGYGSVAVVNNNTLYVGQGTGSANFYEFDPAGSNGLGDWKPKAVLNVSRSYPVAFSINGDVYWGGGSDNTGQALRTFSKYTFSSNGYIGSAVAPMPGTDIIQGEGFAYNGKGYVLTWFGKFFEYDTAADTWTRKGEIVSSVTVYHVGIINGRILATDPSGKLYEYMPSY